MALHNKPSKCTLKIAPGDKKELKVNIELSIALLGRRLLGKFAAHKWCASTARQNEITIFLCGLKQALNMPRKQISRNNFTYQRAKTNNICGE